MGSSSWDFVESMNYWYTVMAHELAHNLVSAHGSHHSYFTETFVQQYMEKFKFLSQE